MNTCKSRDFKSEGWEKESVLYIKNSSWITKFETDKAGKLQFGTNVISEDKEKDTRVVELKWKM